MQLVIISPSDAKPSASSAAPVLFIACTSACVKPDIGPCTTPNHDLEVAFMYLCSQYMVSLHAKICHELKKGGGCDGVQCAHLTCGGILITRMDGHQAVRAKLYF